MYRKVFLSTFFMCLMFGNLSVAGDNAKEDSCINLSISHTPSDYYGPGIYSTSCPGKDKKTVHCHHYHAHWVCRKGDKLYWDRRLDSAMHSA